MARSFLWNHTHCTNHNHINTALKDKYDQVRSTFYTVRAQLTSIRMTKEQQRTQLNMTVWPIATKYHITTQNANAACPLRHILTQ